MNPSTVEQWIAVLSPYWTFTCAYMAPVLFGYLVSQWFKYYRREMSFLLRNWHLIIIGMVGTYVAAFVMQYGLLDWSPDVALKRSAAIAVFYQVVIEIWVVIIDTPWVSKKFPGLAKTIKAPRRRRDMEQTDPFGDTSTNIKS